MKMKADRHCILGKNGRATSVDDHSTAKPHRSGQCTICIHQPSDKPTHPVDRNLKCSRNDAPNPPTKKALEQSQAVQLRLRVASRNPQIVGEYFLDILRFSLAQQKNPRSKEQRLDKLASKMVLFRRTSVMDVLINIADAMDCNRSLFMGCYLFDRALEMLLIKKKDMILEDWMGLAAVAAFFMAFKLCEIYPPELADTLELLRMPFTKIDQVMELQADILNYLSFSVTRNCQDFFLGLFGQILKLTSQQMEDCTALLEYGILCNQVLDVQPSLRAAGVIYLLYEGMSHYSSTSFNMGMLLYVSGYQQKQLRKCGSLYLTSLRECRMRNLSSIKEKYLQKMQEHLSWIRNIKDL